MKKYFLFLLVVCAVLYPMQESNITLVDGDNQSDQVFSLGQSDEVIMVHTADKLSERYEHALLCGLLSLYRDLAYGELDLRPLEQAIATQHGYPDVFSCEHEYKTDADRVTRSTDPMEIMFVQSPTKIKNPFKMPALARGQRLTIRTHLTDRISMFRFLHSALNPPKVSEGGMQQRPIFISHLEHAVLAELPEHAD